MLHEWLHTSTPKTRVDDSSSSTCCTTTAKYYNSYTFSRDHLVILRRKVCKKKCVTKRAAKAGKAITKRFGKRGKTLNTIRIRIHYYGEIGSQTQTVYASLIISDRYQEFIIL